MEGISAAYKDNGLFSHAYLVKLLKQQGDWNKYEHIYSSLRGWVEEANFDKQEALKESLVAPLLDTLGFVRGSFQDNQWLPLFEDYGQNNPIAICFLVPVDECIDSTIKGKFWAEKIIRNLRQQNLSWGILTDGKKWRLYFTNDQTLYETYFEVDLVLALENNDKEALYAYITFFGPDSFLKDDKEAGEVKLDSYRTAAEKATEEIEKHLQQRTDKILKHICDSIIEHLNQDDYSEDECQEIFQNAIYLLYRILFILYAESRELLPIKNEKYYIHSLRNLVEKAIKYETEGHIDDESTDLWDKLYQLFDWVNTGNRELGITDYDGDLFDNREKKLIARRGTIKNIFMSKILFHLGCIENPKTNKPFRIDYQDLSVRHLGNLYEGILEYRLFVAKEPMIARADSGGSLKYLTKKEAGKLKKSDIEINKNSVYFTDAEGFRKSSGSYYTPEAVVDFIVCSSVIETLKKRKSEFEYKLQPYYEVLNSAATEKEMQRIQSAIDNELVTFIENKILDIKICDPATGSGHFLVNSAQHITNFIINMLNETSWINESIDTDPIKWRRRVVEKCLYGVDMNPLALELAKLSLWLISLDINSPLTFLNHHLKVGNSLLGVELDYLTKLPSGSTFDSQQVSMPSYLLEKNLPDILTAIADIAAKDTLSQEDVAVKKEKLEAVMRRLSQLKRLADFRTALFHGMDKGNYESIIFQIDTEIDIEKYMPEEVKSMAKEKKFFHWELEFPEVFLKKLGFDIIVGNPPYSGHSSSKGERIEELLKDYKQEPGGGRLKEKNPKWLNDDYVKFLRYGQYFIKQNKEGILAFINNHGFLDNPTFRGMRWHLLNTFDKIYIVDLHGNVKKKEVCPDGSPDENVFDIQQGVSINIFVRSNRRKRKDSSGKVFHYDLYGNREFKYNFLQNNTLDSIDFTEVKQEEPQYFFVPIDFKIRKEYEEGFSVNELFYLKGSAIVTKRDKISIRDTKEDSYNVVKNILQMPKEEFYNKYNLPRDVRDWKYDWAKNDIQEHGLNNSFIKKINYRPFDQKFIYYTGKSRGFIGWPVIRIMKHLFYLNNVSLMTTKKVEVGNFAHCIIAKGIIESHAISMKEINYAFPLYLYEEEGSILTEAGEPERTPNLNMEIVNQIAENLRLQFTPEQEDSKDTFTPIDILDYIYAILHSPTYREKYNEFLKKDFPRVPYPKDAETFWKLVKMGGELRQIHLLESPLAENYFTTCPEGGSNEVKKVSYEDEKVWINESQYFDNVPQVVWEFYIGGYQPAQKWLKDRKGIALNGNDIEHYSRIVFALMETDRLMKEIDQVNFFDN